MSDIKERTAYLLKIGLNDEYSVRVGDQKYLRCQYGIDGESIARKIEEIING